MRKVDLWRIAATTRDYTADDTSGAGAAISPGRWNAKDQRVLYTAKHLALAVLETAAHLEAGTFPLDRYVVRISVRESDYEQRRILSPDGMPLDWDAIPDSASALALGSQWYAEGKQLVLQVPSVIAPEEPALIINATHPDAKHVQAAIVRKFDYKLFRRK